MFQGMGPITSKGLSGWQRTGENPPSARALYLVYGFVALLVGTFFFLWLS